MAVVSRSRSRAVPAALLLLLILAVASAAAVGVAAKTNGHDVAEESNKEESWTGWAKDKISEGLGLKHHADVDEEEAARKAGQTVKSARESAQHTASCKNPRRPQLSFRN
jgi:hypothetical protein